MGKRKRLQQHGIHDGEHGGVRADPERQGQDNGRRKFGVLSEQAGAVAKIVIVVGRSTAQALAPGLMISG